MTKTVFAFIASGLAVGVILQSTATAAPQGAGDTSATLSAAQLNTLLQTRCTVCHKTASPGGGLVFEGLDAAHLDPAIAALAIVKIRDDHAMGAAGTPYPDAATTDAFLRAMSAAAATATGRWTVTLAEDPLDSKHGHVLVTARTVQNAHELTVSCNGATKHGMAQVPGGIPVAAEAAPPASNGSFPTTFDVNGKRVAFSASDLSPTVRQMLSTCFQTQSRTN